MTFHEIQTLPPREEFSPLLRYHRQRIGASRNTLAKLAALDPSYVGRLELGERRPPPRGDLLDRLLDELRLTDYERDKLLVAGGLAPRCVQLLGHWPRVLDEIAHRMLELEGDERDELVYILARIAIRFGARDVSEVEA